MTPQEIQRMKDNLERQAQENEGFTAWYWYGCIVKLAGGCPLKMREVKQLPFLECADLLLYWLKKDEDIEREAKKERQRMNKNNLQQF